MKLLPRKSDTPFMIGAPTVSVTLVTPLFLALQAVVGLAVPVAVLRCDLNLWLSSMGGPDGLL
jgi:hypothetical protein